MRNEKMTVRQLDMAVRTSAEQIFIKSNLYTSKLQEPKAELTNALRSFDGVMGLEVFHLDHTPEGYTATVDLPHEVIKALAEYKAKEE